MKSIPAMLRKAGASLGEFAALGDEGYPENFSAKSLCRPNKKLVTD